MKKYIKPEINALELETLPAIAAGSPSVNEDGTEVNLGGNGGHGGAEQMGRVKRKDFGSLWEEPTDDEMEEDF